MNRPPKDLPALNTMTVAGMMSGTSADGIDVALVRIGPRRKAVRGSAKAPGDEDSNLHIKLLAHSEFPFRPALRRAVLAAQDAQSTTTAELARLNWRLGLAYAEAMQATLAAHPCRLELIGCHGQTIYHQAAPAPYAGRRFACTWQIGEMAPLVAAMRVPVVSNFRPADMIAGGQGAPLVPLLDFVYFRHPTRGRVLQNIGGIANLTAIPAASTIADVTAFDTGPGNMLIDAVMQQLFEKRFDRDGKIAARGRMLAGVISQSLKDPFFARRPPRSAGREQFGAAFATAFIAACAAQSAAPEDTVATATALTAHTIADAYGRFVHPRMKGSPVDYFLSGGGTRNGTLTAMLTDLLTPLGCVVRGSNEAGMPTQAKEAVAFALLAYQTFHARSGNVPPATGATRPAILGQITNA